MTERTAETIEGYVVDEGRSSLGVAPRSSNGSPTG
jgi:hypothetical protein